MKAQATYRKLPLKTLLERIVINRDEDALNEFHTHRTLFQYLDYDQLLLSKLLFIMRESFQTKERGTHLDKAYDLTMDKFSRLPQHQEQNGIDCTRYFKAALGLILGKRDGLQTEIDLGIILQRLVIRHFKWSLLEAKRSETFTRYKWNINGKVLRIRLPKELSGSQRKDWLQNHIVEVNPNRPGEQHRVQLQIDEYFHQNIAPAVIKEATQDLPWNLCDQIQLHGIEQTLIQEKCDRIDEQRPSIRNLGTNKLRQLIETVFQAISTNTSNDVTTARAFHLSKASYSRFAGSNWQSPHIPDLWKNLAGIIARHPVYTELAQTQGIWKTIQSITEHEPSLTSP